MVVIGVPAPLAGFVVCTRDYKQRWAAKRHKEEKVALANTPHSKPRQRLAGRLLAQSSYTTT
jgi:hypothetical protein